MSAEKSGPDNSKKTDIVHSPCVGVCALDDDDLCIGCLRSGSEISHWGRLDNDGKRAVLQAVAERLKNTTQSQG